MAAQSWAALRYLVVPKRKIPDACASGILHGDPYGNRTRLNKRQTHCK